MRGPVQDEPQGPTLLNTHLFGAPTIGGNNVTVRPEVLPFDWGQAFGREAPRTLEIGFNRGKFLSELALRWPDHDHIGIEIRRRYCWRLANLLDRDPEHGGNVRLVWADAKRVTADLLPPGSLHAIFVNFPDPWWKRRHEKRRLVQPEYAQELRDLLAVGGAVWVKSDVAAIAEEIDASLAGTPGFEGPEPFGPDDLPFTYREAKCVKAGMPIHRFRYRRVAVAAGDGQSTTNT
ncbi:MAG: tRNA (guanosine(46)-N7)-methyltransferase TrmB [Myxococcales bacterium]|nr:tRNA (guanosine(46)-N7)-methyltransferase TrmB [Myxococcales bacterium]MCB9522008.1 tRNA (guanosine(46)-N7)-methyltransferase TrmB [Myxococcales bacterium]